MSSEQQSNRLTGAEYCSGVSPLSSTEHCLHFAMFYRPCSNHHRPSRPSLNGNNNNINNNNHQLPQALRSSPFPFQFESSPVPPGLCTLPSQDRIFLAPRYTLFRLVYEYPEQRPGSSSSSSSITPLREYKLFLLTSATPTPVRGIYFHVAGTPADPNGMTYIETVGSLPERQSTPLGTVAPENFTRFRNLCRRIPAPPCQFDGTRPMLAWAPRRHSREWTQDVIRLTTAASVLDVAVREEELNADATEGPGRKGGCDVLNFF
ncbi:hypothetical protein PT974_01355 [Cladobotryum mycophilum]|uniref:Uncharacterized protein n=1 Tax=Cladobotryum mycophilum TaxID=491253 RepID=A0ABR0T4V9_9HYPO